MSEGRDRIDLTSEIHLDEAPSAIFLSRVLERGIAQVKTQDWPTSASSLDATGEPIVSVEGPRGEQRFLDRGDTLVFVSLYHGHVYAAVAGSEGSIDMVFEWLRDHLPAQIELPMPPTAVPMGSELAQFLDQEEDGQPAKPWKLLMLEDTGELLTADARALIGQGLSRFLNVVDGLIGQGLRVLALVTTNEEVRRLHPAVARPGRSAANIEFTALSTEEAAAWRVRHGIEGADVGPTTLASLYAALHGLGAKRLSPTGFAA